MSEPDLSDYVEKDESSSVSEQEVRIIDMTSYPVRDVLDILLQDKTTGKNIIWATDAYKIFGYSDKSPISPSIFKSNRYLLQPRINKSVEDQQERTRKKAEVFTPVWLCNKMNNYCDEQWFGRKDVFNHEKNDNSWEVIEDSIQFPEGKGWKEYVDSRRLEITCGEAPYLVSRYDAATGEFILPPLRRIGIIDRKLRVVNENTSNEEDWETWTIRAFQSCYGYEWQGDSLLIARVNLLMTFYDYYQEHWSKDPDMDLLKQIANIIAWNLWQMDGLKDSVPFGRPAGSKQQMTFDSFFGGDSKPPSTSAQVCKINNWRSKESLQFRKCKDRGKMSKKMFDYVIGNPPYQQEFTDEGNKTYAAPVYHEFMDAAFEVGDAVELIHPARFLFNAGSTPKAWNEKMLNDPHFKVLQYEEDASTIFNGVEIKGGVAITYRDISSRCGPIEVFTKYPELNSILHKTSISESITKIIFIQNRLNLDTLLSDHPEFKSQIGSDGKDSRFEKNIFAKIPLFVEQPFEDAIKTLGIHDNKRELRYIPRKYVDLNHENLLFWKVVVAVANGDGKFGQPLSKPVIMAPGEAYTRSFIGIGSFSDMSYADSVITYLKTKFLRALLSVLKVTAMTNRDVWQFVPIQDFSENSDINWNKSPHEVDIQLYKKYNLSSDEIDFIESHVQEMD